MMSGFADQLKTTLVSVKSVHNPKMNYRSVRNLMDMTNLTRKVLAVMEESPSASRT